MLCIMPWWQTDVPVCPPSLYSFVEGPQRWCPEIGGSHVAQEMAALCSLAFIRSAAMLEDFRSGSMFRSYPLMPVPMPGLPNKLPMCVCPMWPPELGTPKKSDTPLAACGWGGMQEVTESQGTTQPGTGDAALLLPIQEGFWICNKSKNLRCIIATLISRTVVKAFIKSNSSCFELLHWQSCRILNGTQHGDLSSAMRHSSGPVLSGRSFA